MRHKYLGSIGVAAAIAAALAFTTESVAGQAAARGTTAAGKGTALRTPWGDPDLQGAWTNSTTTPLERPSDLGEKLTLSAEERAVRDATLSAAAALQRPPQPGDTGAYNAFWLEA